MKKIFLTLFFGVSILSSQDFNFLPKIHNGVLVKHTYYSLSYVEKYEQPEWVAYLLKSEMIEGGAERSNRFFVDPLIPTGSADPQDYKETGYDRGHLCPAADMKWDEQAMLETFYMSNMSPQFPKFNRGIWKKLEECVREWVKKESVLYIVSGPILKDSLPIIGIINKISVPEQYYKVILSYHGNNSKAIAFIMPNTEIKGSYLSYAVPVDSVESATGIDFFPELPDEIENAVESNVELKEWKKLATDDDNSKMYNQCRSLTKDGHRCRNNATSNSPYCKIHQK